MDIDRALSRKLIGKRHHKALLAYLRERLPRLEQPSDKTAWLRKAARIPSLSACSSAITGPASWFTTPDTFSTGNSASCFAMK